MSVFLSANDLLIPVVGDYVYYRINRNNSEELLGIAYFGENLLRVRYYKNGQNILIDINHNGLRSDFTYSSNVIYPKEFDEAAIENIINEIVYIVKNRYNINEVDFPSEIIATTIQGSLLFEYWIPLVQLRKMVTTGLEYTLIDFGRMDKEDDSRFYLFEVENRVPKTFIYTLYDRPKFEVEHNGIVASISTDWNRTTDEYNSTAYVLSDYIGRDAYLLFEELDLNKINTEDIYFFIKYYLLMGDETIIAESIKVIEDDTIEVRYSTYNPEINMETMHFSKNLYEEENIWNVVTMSVFSSLFVQNQSYFMSIYNSIKLK